MILNRRIIILHKNIKYAIYSTYAPIVKSNNIKKKEEENEKIRMCKKRRCYARLSNY